jgi:peptidoglycan/LPS O-acetylase OafA/YrhL
MINSRMDISLLGLDVFFFTSGFLVTSSLMRRPHVIEFLFARVLRIFPALLVVQILTVFGLGLLLTTLPCPGRVSEEPANLYAGIVGAQPIDDLSEVADGA